MGEKELIRKTFEGEVAFARLRNRLVHALISTVATSPDWPAVIYNILTQFMEKLNILWTSL